MKAKESKPKTVREILLADKKNNPNREKQKIKELQDRKKKLSKEMTEFVDTEVKKTKNSKQVRVKREEVSTFIYNDELYEQLYDPEKKKSVFVVLHKATGKIDTFKNVKIENITYAPIKDKLLEKRAIVLTTGVTEYGKLKTLEKKISNFMYKYLDITDKHKKRAIWYILLTWVTENIYTVPYLRALGDSGTGKTRYLDVIGGLCYKTMWIGGAVNSAPIFRIIDKWHGTAIFDEFTLRKSDDATAIIQIMNNGFERNKPILRCVGKDHVVCAFDPFGTKIIASREHFDDIALETRCITENTTQTDRKDIPTNLTKQFFKERDELRNMLMMYRLKNWDKINPDETINIDFGDVEGRIKQAFLPFTVLFQHDEEILREFIREAQKENIALIEERATSLEGAMLIEYLNIIRNEHLTPTVSTIQKQLISSQQYIEENIPIRKLGKLLRSMGFDSESKKENGRTRRILIITEIKLRKLIKRYVLPEEQEMYLHEKRSSEGVLF